jgi:hypothetical protein
VAKRKLSTSSNGPINVYYPEVQNRIHFYRHVITGEDIL